LSADASLKRWNQEKSEEKVRGKSLTRQSLVLNQALEGSWESISLFKTSIKALLGRERWFLLISGSD
jgi:hypothetical protein